MYFSRTLTFLFFLMLLVSDNHFQMESRMCLAGKKKSPCKRIIGFQVSASNQLRLLVCNIYSFSHRDSTRYRNFFNFVVYMDAVLTT